MLLVSSVVMVVGEAVMVVWARSIGAGVTITVRVWSNRVRVVLYRALMVLVPDRVARTVAV